MPSNEIDDTEEMDLPAVVETDEADISKEIEQSADAGSSTAEDASKTEDEGVLSVVRDVVGQRKPEASVASSAKSEEAGPEAGETQPQNQKRDDENYSDVPFNKHPRFQEVLGRLKTEKVDAERYRNVQKFLDDNGLSSEEAADLLSIGALMKTNPVEAWRRAAPTIQKLLVAAGEVLPDDLAQQVRNGEISHEHALRLSRTSAETNALRSRQTFEEQRAQRQAEVAEQERAARAQSAVVTAAGEWEADRTLKDPNFDAKLPALRREIQALQASGWLPNTPEGVQKQLNQAYATVNRAFRAPAAPAAKPALRPVIGGQVSGNAQGVPQNTNDHINRVLAKRRSAG